MGMPGRVVVKSVTAGTITPPPGATLFALVAHSSLAAATVQIGTQDAIAIIQNANPTFFAFPEDAFTSPGAIVCTNTDSVTAIFKLVGAT